jgi:nucleotide-binding universal stress UspA family protein
MTALMETEPGSISKSSAADSDSLAYTRSGSGIAVVAPLSSGLSIAGLRQSGSEASFLSALGSANELLIYEERQSLEEREQRSDGKLPRLEQRGADLWQVADAAGIERGVLYAASAAGPAILQAAIQRPDRVLGLLFDQVSLSREAAPLGSNSRPDFLPPSLAEGLRSLAPDLRSRTLIIEAKRAGSRLPLAADRAEHIPGVSLLKVDRPAEALGAIHAFFARIDIEEGRFASRLTAEISNAAGAAEHSLTTVARIIVPVGDELTSERAAAMACRLGGPQGAEIILVHVVEIPLARSLDDVTEIERARAERALGIGRAIVANHGMRTRSRLLIERSASRGIIRVAREEQADLIAMAIGEKRRTVPAEMSPTMREVLRGAPCEVLIDQAQPEIVAL